MKTIVLQAVLVLALLASSCKKEENAPRASPDSPASPRVEPGTNTFRLGPVTEVTLSSSPDSPASPKAVPGTNTFRFGPVTEVLLSPDSAGKDYLLDLDTGRVLTPAQEMRPERLVNPALGLTFQSSEMAWRAYLYGMGVDIINKDHLDGLVSCRMVMEPAGDEKKWDSLSAGELVRALDRLWRDPQPLSEGVFGPRDHKVTPPHTFLFRTREGRHGILQITEIQRQPKKVKLRFKLVEESGQSAPSTESGVQNPSGQ